MINKESLDAYRRALESYVKALANRNRMKEPTPEGHGLTSVEDKWLAAQIRKEVLK